jgi:hypothetical protein
VPADSTALESKQWKTDHRWSPNRLRHSAATEIRKRGNRWYVRSHDWKLMRSGALFDMKAAPFLEIPVGPNTSDAEARAGRKDLQKVLARLNPAVGKVEKP